MVSTETPRFFASCVKRKALMYSSSLCFSSLYKFSLCKEISLPAYFSRSDAEITRSSTSAILVSPPFWQAKNKIAASRSETGTDPAISVFENQEFRKAPLLERGLFQDFGYTLRLSRNCNC